MLAQNIFIGRSQYPISHPGKERPPESDRTGRRKTSTRIERMDILSLYPLQRTALKIHDEAGSGNIVEVARELAAGVDVNCQEMVSGHSVLHGVCALPDARLEMVRFLIQQGATVTPEVFQAAVQSGSLATLRYLLESRVPVEAQAEESCGALALAAYG